MTSAAANEAGEGSSLAEKWNWITTHHVGRKIVITVGSVAAAGALGFGLLHTDLFSVEQIDVSGNSRLDRNAVLEKSGLRQSMTMISVNEGTMQARLESDPWVESATVESQWPHTVKVSITERKALLQAQTTDNKWAEIGEGGVVLSVADKPYAGLPAALGPTVEPAPGSALDAKSQTLATVSAALPNSLRPKVSQIQQDERGVRLGLTSGVVVLVGSVDDLPAKLTAAATVLQNVEEKSVQTLDVTSPSMPVSTPRVKAAPATTTTTQPGRTTTTQTNPRQTTTKPST